MTISFPSFDIPPDKWSDGTEEPADDIYIVWSGVSIQLEDLQNQPRDVLLSILTSTESDTLADFIAGLL